MNIIHAHESIAAFSFHRLFLVDLSQIKGNVALISLQSRCTCSNKKSDWLSVSMPGDEPEEIGLRRSLCYPAVIMSDSSLTAERFHVIGSHACPPLSHWQGEYVSCLLSLLRQMTDIHFQRLMENFQSKEELKVPEADVLSAALIDKHITILSLSNVTVRLRAGQIL